MPTFLLWAKFYRFTGVFLPLLVGFMKCCFWGSALDPAGGAYDVKVKVEIT